MRKNSNKKYIDEEVICLETNIKIYQTSLQSSNYGRKLLDLAMSLKDKLKTSTNKRVKDTIVFYLPLLYVEIAKVNKGL